MSCKDDKMYWVRLSWTMGRKKYSPIRLQQRSQIRRLPVIGQTIRLIAVPKRGHIVIPRIIEYVIEHGNVILVHTRELGPRFGVLAEWRKLLPVALGSRVVVRHIGHGEIVPHVIFREGEVATVALHAAVVVPASQEDTAAAG